MVNTFHNSTSHHRYDVYLGTLELVRAGSSTPYSTQDVFESEIRFDQQGVDQINSALGDPRFATGIPTTKAPDGGSWITAASRPGWWEKPNGTSPDQPLFDAQARFASAMSAPSLVAAGETASCSDTAAQETVLTDSSGELEGNGSLPWAIYTEVRIGPATIWHGDERAERHEVADGDVDFNTIRSYLVLTVHRLKRTCVVAPAPPPADRCSAAAKDSDRDGIADACDEDPSIPDSCTLRVARSRVFVYGSKPKARLVVKYKTRTPAQVTTTYTAKLANGKNLALGSLKQQFKAQGTFKLPISFDEPTAAKVRSAKSFSVSFSIPGAPKACARAYAKSLTKKQKVGKQAVWFQADSVLGGIF